MILEAPKGPLTLVDGATAPAGSPATRNGFLWGRGEQLAGTPPVRRRAEFVNHIETNVSFLPWETKWADGGSGTHPLSLAAAGQAPVGILEDVIMRNAGTGYTGPAGTKQFNLQAGIHLEARRFECYGGAETWAGVWTGGQTSHPFGGCYQSLLEQFRCERQRRGIYVEHDTWHTTFRDFVVGATEVCVIVEWAYLEQRGPKMGASAFNVFEGFVAQIPSRAPAFLIGPGSMGNVIRNGYIVSPYPDAVHIELPTRLLEPVRAAGTNGTGFTEVRQSAASHPNIVHNVIHIDSTTGKCKPANVSYRDLAIGWSGE